MADSMVPSYLTVDGQGRVTAEFEGHVSAAGLDLLAGTTISPPDDRKVRWLREADGALVAELAAYETAASRQWSALVKSPGGVAGTDPVSLSLGRRADANEASISLDFPGGSAQLLGADGTRPLPQSANFLLRADTIGVGEYRSGIDMGKTTITGNNNPQRSKAIAHNLGQKPKVAFAIADPASPNFYGLARPDDATQITIGIAHRGSVNFSDTHDVYWIAIA